MTQELVDLIISTKELDQERLNHDRESNKLAKRIEGAKADITTKLRELGLTDITIPGVASAAITTVQKPYISDYSLLEQHIRDTGSLDLLHKRLTESAVKARWDDGVQVPGVGLMPEEKLIIK